jgi:signal transduction histidine kinase/CheY-like chemotaxis protein
MTTVSRLLAVEIRHEQDVVLARQRARQVAELLGFDLQSQTKIGTAVSEIVRNAYQYAGGGTITFDFAENEHRSLVIQVSDCGPGIGNLELILGGNYSSKTGMGLGLIGTQRIMDQFTIRSHAQTGTEVRIAKILPAHAPVLSREILHTISRTLARGIPGDPVSEVQQQNQELLRVLNDLQKRKQELVTLNLELEDTNRGVVALYSELDSRADFLKKSTDVKSKFVSNMTHEFRTPLNSIIALSNMLIQRSDGELTAEQDRQVGYILRSATILSDLVNDLLDMARVDAGKVAIKPSPFTIESLFGTLKGLLRPLLTKASSVTLDFDEPAPDMPLLDTDEGKVSQILRNLISNALKFTRQGQVRVSCAPACDGQITFCVTDTGSGIAAENFSIIFEAFGQVESGQSRTFVGTGLGLPLSRRLAELLGGSLQVNSTLGRGSVFSLTIPIHYHGKDEGEIVEGAPHHHEHASRRQALIIDDDEVSRYLLRSMLPPVFEVVEATCGSDGIELAIRLNPDVILLDMNMPTMSGLEVLTQLRRHPTMARVPIVIYSAQPMDETMTASLKAADAILLVSKSDTSSVKEALLRTLQQINLVMGASEIHHD